MLPTLEDEDNEDRSWLNFVLEKNLRPHDNLLTIISPLSLTFPGCAKAVTDEEGVEVKDDDVVDEAVSSDEGA